MAEFTVTSANLSLVSPINSIVDRVFDVDGVMFFTAASHPAVAIKIDDYEAVKDTMIQGATISITPGEGTDTYAVTVTPAVTKKSATRSTSPSMADLRMLQSW